MAVQDSAMRLGHGCQLDHHLPDAGLLRSLEVDGAGKKPPACGLFQIMIVYGSLSIQFGALVVGIAGTIVQHELRIKVCNEMHNSTSMHN